MQLRPQQTLNNLSIKRKDSERWSHPSSAMLMNRTISFKWHVESITSGIQADAHHSQRFIKFNEDLAIFFPYRTFFQFIIKSPKYQNYGSESFIQSARYNKTNVQCWCQLSEQQSSSSTAALYTCQCFY